MSAHDERNKQAKVLEPYRDAFLSAANDPNPLNWAITLSPAGWITAAAGLNDAIAALRRASPETGWQPIETAPIGVSVLLWKENTREIYVAARIHGGAGLGWCTPDGHEIFKAVA
jgi:hypothetical protein